MSTSTDKDSESEKYSNLKVLSMVDLCFKSFTQNKMKKLFEISAIRHLFRYYVISIFEGREEVTE